MPPTTAPPSDAPALSEGASPQAVPPRNPVVIDAVTGLQGALCGARALGHGMRWLLRHPGLWKYAALSVAVALVIAVALVLGAWRVHAWAMGFIAAPEQRLWYVGWWILRWALWLGLVALALALAPILSSLTAAPFHDRLSERVEQSLQTAPDDTFAWGRFVRDVGTGLVHSLLNLAIYLPLAALCLALNVIPVLGSAAAAVGGFVLTATMLSLEFTDFATARRRWSWRRKVALVRAQPALMLGFGAAAAVVVSIPLMTLLTAPIAVVGGTLLVLALQDRDLLNAPAPSAPDASPGLGTGALIP